MSAVELLPAPSVLIQEMKKERKGRKRILITKKIANSPVTPKEIPAAAAPEVVRHEKPVNSLFPIMEPLLNDSSYYHQTGTDQHSSTSPISLLSPLPRPLLRQPSLASAYLADGPRLPHRLSTSTLSSPTTRDMRSRGAVPASGPALPGTPNTSSNGHNRNVSGGTPFEMIARSPPNPGSKSMYFKFYAAFPQSFSSSYLAPRSEMSRA